MKSEELVIEVVEDDLDFVPLLDSNRPAPVMIEVKLAPLERSPAPVYVFPVAGEVNAKSIKVVDKLGDFSFDMFDEDDD